MSPTQNNEENAQTGNREKPPRTQVEKLRLELKAASARARTEEKARLKLEEALAQAQAEAQEAQEEAERERQLRHQAEMALSEAQKKPAIEPVMTAGSGAESRLVFILRLSLDEDKQPKRVEIEENQTRKRDSFAGLESERLMAFIQTFLPSPPRAKEKTPVHIPALEEKEDIIEQRAKIVVSQVVVVKPSDVFNQLVIDQGESAQIRIRYYVDDMQVLADNATDEAFDIKVYARSVQDSAYKLLFTHQQAVLPGNSQYSVEFELKSLEPGDYNLFTVVSHPRARIAGFFDGPVFEVLNPRTMEILQPEDRRVPLNSPN